MDMAVAFDRESIFERKKGMRQWVVVVWWLPRAASSNAAYQGL
jgi:hypothetical protein